MGLAWACSRLQEWTGKVAAPWQSCCSRNCSETEKSPVEVGLEPVIHTIQLNSKLKLLTQGRLYPPVRSLGVSDSSVGQRQC